MTILALNLPITTRAESVGELPAASAEKLPRWRGFNLLNKFFVTSEKPFKEEDFQLVHELGFNFVRLPMDYRCWIVGKDWARIDEARLKEIDQAVEWGRKYGVHVCINFHRAPGYTVAQPAESRSLWSDPEAQRVCALHWATFARRYKGIPNSQLSFNLFNEPGDIDGATYYKVVKLIVEAIRKEDPERLVIADGRRWGRAPTPELIPLRVAQATRGYEPFTLTHYKADWVDGSDKWPVPTWPLSRVSALLYGPGKKELHAPLALEGKFPAGTKLSLKVGTVSSKARFVIRAGEETLLDKTFISGPESREGEKVVYKPEYKIYQNEFDQAHTIALKQDCQRITLNVDEGDWMTLTELSVELPGGGVFPLVLLNEWGVKPVSVAFDPSHPEHPWTTPDAIDRQWLWNKQLVPWKEVESKSVGVMVGEWGCHNETPHAVTLLWMEDCLNNFQQAGWGWALWELSGSFGIFDSQRKDVVYEDYKGHKLDRKMLELLQRF